MMLSRSNSLIAASALAMTVALSSPVWSQDSTTESDVAESGDSAATGCASPTLGASPAAVQQFVSNPAALLERNPLGGLALSNEVRTLAITDISTVDALIALATGATSGQASAIGSGLARAAAICVATNPDLAEQIQLKIAASENPTLVTAFLTGSGNQDTAGLGGGTGGGAGAGGGGAGGGGGIGGSAAGTSSSTGGSTLTNAGGSLVSGGGNLSFDDGGSSTTTRVVSPTSPI